MQGLLELANVPYVGAGVLGSAVGMDKAVMKTLFAARGLPIGPHLVAAAPRVGSATRPAITARVAQRARLSRCSSSRPTSDRASASRRRRSTHELRRRDGAGAAVRPQDRHRGRRAERARDRVRRARQRRPAGVGSRRDHPVPREFYDYEAKYLDAEGATMRNPGRLCRPPTTEQVQRLSDRGVPGRRRCREWRAWTSSSTARPASCSSTRSTRFPGSRPSACIRRCGRRSGLPYPALDRSPDHARARAPRRKAAAAHQHHVRARGPRVRRCDGALVRRVAPARSCPATRRAQTSRPDRPASARARLRRHLRRALRAGPGAAHADLRARPGARPKPVSCSTSSSLWWQIQLDPEEPRRTTTQFQTQVGRGHRGHRGVDRARAASGPKPGSILAARTARGRSGGCCAENGWRRRATANASRTRSSGRWRSTRAAGRLLRHRPLSLLRRRRAGRAAKMLRWLLLLPGGDRAAGHARRCCARASERTAPAERSRLSAAPDLSVVREAAAARAGAAARPARPPSAEIRSSCSSSPRSRTSTCTICRPACARGRRCSTRRRRVASPSRRWRRPPRGSGSPALLDRLSESDAAIEHLRAVIETKPAGAARRASRARSCSSDRRSIISAAANDALARVSRGARRACRQAIPIGIVRAARAGLRGR